AADAEAAALADGAEVTPPRAAGPTPRTSKTAQATRMPTRASAVQRCMRSGPYHSFGFWWGSVLASPVSDRRSRGATGRRSSFDPRRGQRRERRGRAMVKVECQGCQAPYQIDERRIPPTGLKMRCPKCGTSVL